MTWGREGRTEFLGTGGGFGKPFISGGCGGGGPGIKAFLGPPVLTYGCVFGGGASLGFAPAAIKAFSVGAKY